MAILFNYDVILVEVAPRLALILVVWLDRNCFTRLINMTQIAKVAQLILDEIYSRASLITHDIARYVSFIKIFGI